MVTILRSGGLRVVIFVNDHHPAHVHVFGDGEAKFELVGAGAPILLWADRMTRAETRRAIRLVAENRIALLQRWEEIHGRTD